MDLLSNKQQDTTIVRIIKNWSEPDMFRQTPNSLGVWKNVYFTTDNISDVDYVIVLNYSNVDVEVNTYPSNVWVVMQEPYIKGFFDWMVEKHSIYAKVFTHHIFSNKSKYISSYPMLVWHVNKSYDELKSIAIPGKTKNISWITSNLQHFPGHRNRMEFLERVKQSELEVDLFGRGIKFIEDKWDGLAPYKYALAIENSSSKDYWTEKLADCFLSYTLPIYYGCANLEAYFPKDSFIKIDINKPEEAFEIIRNAIQNKEYEKRFDAICEARELILEKYNFFANISNEIEKNKTIGKKEHIVIKAYRQSIEKKVEYYIYRLPEKIKKLISLIKGKKNV